MTNQHEYTRTLSLNLSEILSGIGVNEKTVKLRRKEQLLDEIIETTTYKFLGTPLSVYYFGSRSEGTTTMGLTSDGDRLLLCHDYNLIHVQDFSQWEHGKFNLLMIQDDTTSAGYCLLQVLDRNEPRPACPSCLQLLPVESLKAKEGKVLLTNNFRSVDLQPFIPDDNGEDLDIVLNGPAQTYRYLGDEMIDSVTAFHCKTWPIEAQPWLSSQGTGPWPTREMKKLCETTGCLVVPVSSKMGASQDLEWRISTCHAERYLMFSLNITQIRCYVLMKMVLKVFIKPQCDNVLTSFMCKNVLFMCIQNTQLDVWQEHNLFACLNCCLLMLQRCVMKNNCPHFIIPGNNLMAGKISPLNQRKILEALQILIQSEGGYLYQIPIDALGVRLFLKLNLLHDHVFQNYPELVFLDSIISSYIIASSAFNIQFHTHGILLSIQDDGSKTLAEYIFRLCRRYTQRNMKSIEKCAYKLLASPLCTTLASVMASVDISSHNKLSSVPLSLFSAGLNSDASSGRLKLASALYYAGEILKAEFVLRKTRSLFDLNIVQSVCSCVRAKMLITKPGFISISSKSIEEEIKHTTAFCVKFLRSEMYCTPQELQYEMFRSTGQEKRDRKKYFENWLDWAVVDSLPFLFFLQYKTYAFLLKDTDKYQALINLATCIEIEKDHLHHRETALNLLGQCFEKEKRFTEALKCYYRSLNERAKHNVARIHICRVLNMLINHKDTYNVSPEPTAI